MKILAIVDHLDSFQLKDRLHVNGESQGETFVYPPTIPPAVFLSVVVVRFRERLRCDFTYPIRTTEILIPILCTLVAVHYYYYYKTFVFFSSFVPPSLLLVLDSLSPTSS